jgi:hypothetical protein
MIAALYVASNGAYFGLPDVDPWDEARDARDYAGPWPVVAHPPCARWTAIGKSAYVRYGAEWMRPGNDGGCFAAALAAVRKWGGVLEHPANSMAWDRHGLKRPPRDGGWVRADAHGWTCCVAQQHYGHRSRKMTWLYAVGTDRPPLRWGVPIDRAPYQCGGHCGATRELGVLSKRECAATPSEFRDVLLALAATAEGRAK